MVQLFGDIPGVEVYFDDIFISSKTLEEHDRTLSVVLARALANNVKFNSSKIQYRTNKITFMGFIIVNGNVEPTDKYIRAIKEMPVPRNKTDVLRLLDLFKFLARFIPNLSQKSAALRNLTKNNVEWKWTDDHSTELNSLLESISGPPVLTFYDPNKPITIQTDSSKDGLGSVLLQEGKPVAYASRTLSKCEQKWAQIEKELLAIVFACERFHYFLYGRQFVVDSDHKPLETLVKRDIDDVTPRLQRMFLRLLKYPGLSIVYKPGKEMLIADCLSRASLSDSKELDQGISIMVHSLTRQACLSKENYDLYVRILNEDERYSRISRYGVSGWPGYHQVDDLSQSFHRYKDELHYENKLLFKNHRLVIPTKLQSKICKLVHEPHLGIEKTLARARQQFFWPGMTDDITKLVKSCKVCEKFTRNNQKETLLQEETPQYPFHRLATDIFEYAGCDFLALIDAYSGFIIVRKLKEKTARHVIDTLDQIFSCYGYPTEMKSDNVPFNSREFEQYSNDSNIVFKFSSPGYPQSNGLAEKGVAIAKNILKRCYEASELERFQYRILEYNTTPVASMRLSPSHLFFGRLIKNRLPISGALLHRKELQEVEVQGRLEKKNQKRYYDRHAKDLSVGEKIIFKKNGKWCYGSVTRKVNYRSYIIADDFDNQFHRNRRLIVRMNNRDFKPGDITLNRQFKQVGTDITRTLNDNAETPVGSSEVHDCADSGPVADPLIENPNSNSDPSVAAASHKAAESGTESFNEIATPMEA